jgi:uncharacterized protein (TIGR03435 family)
MGVGKGFSAMRMGRIGRKVLDCGKALFWLPCCAAGTMALLLAANGVWVSAQAAAPASQAAAPPAAQPSTPASPKDIAGIWQGTLHFSKTDQHPQFDLRLVVKISKTDNGALKGVWYSIDQGGQSVPIATVSFQDGVLKFKVTVVDRSYEGKMSEDGKSIAGTWMEGTTPMPLPLERATADTAWAIPEPPKPMAQDADPTLEVATIKPSQPNRPGKLFTFQGAQFKTFNTNMNDLIALAYGVHSKQIINAPPWFGTELFDVDGKPDVPGRPNLKQMGSLIQKLLADRFALKFHHEQRELSVYAIRLASGGPKMSVSTAGPNDGSGFGLRGFGDLVVRNMTMATFATWMQSGVMDKPVVDETELKDRYDFNLKWTPDDSQFGQFRGTNGPITPPAGDNPNAPPGLYTAVQEQLGLKIESTKAPDDVIVIDHLDHPSPN